MLTSEERLPHLRLVKFGGEPATRKDVELFQRHCLPDCFLYNGLASTETGGSVRAFFVDHAMQLTGSVVPAGYAVEDVETLLLRGYPETFLHCCNEIKQHPCGNETRGDRRERVY